MASALEKRVPGLKLEDFLYLKEASYTNNVIRYFGRIKLDSKETFAVTFNFNTTLRMVTSPQIHRSVSFYKARFFGRTQKLSKIISSEINSFFELRNYITEGLTFGDLTPVGRRLFRG